jgi:hypothetical protein
MVPMSDILHVSTLRHEEWGGPKRYIRITVHDNLSEFRKAAQNYSPHEDFVGSVGCFHPAPTRERYVGKRWVDITDEHWGGVMRLAKGWINLEVVAHESVHAAAAIWRRDVMPNLRLGEDCGPHEEMLAYMVGDISMGVYRKLYEEDLI